MRGSSARAGVLLGAALFASAAAGSCSASVEPTARPDAAPASALDAAASAGDGSTASSLDAGTRDAASATGADATAVAGADATGVAGADASAGASADAGASATVTGGEINPACPNDHASIVSWSFRARLDIGTLKHARVTMVNDGTTTWSEADQVRLGNPGNTDPFVDNARFSLPAGPTVAPGATYDWDLLLRAPLTPGVYTTRWQMVREGVCWFGQIISVDVEVGMPVATGVCADPTPPDLHQMNVKVHIVGPNRTTIDSTPIVYGHDYCAEIGYTDDRLFCPPRTEGNPDTDVCNEYVVGRATDTGRIGPTWTFDGQLCGPNGPGNCDNHTDNQFLLFVYGPGVARACGNKIVICGETTVP